MTIVHETDVLLGQPKGMGKIGRGKTALLLCLLCIIIHVVIGIRAEVINKDGPTYLQMAAKWFESPSKVIHDNDYHVGYPIAVAFAHRALEYFGLDSSQVGWEWAGRVVSILSAVAVTLAVWIFTGLTFNWRAAFFAAFFLNFSRKWVGLSADVMSDPLAIAFQAWAILLSLFTLHRLQRNSRLAIFLAILTGLCAGLGYLVRPESLLCVALGCLLWIVSHFQFKLNWRLTLASIVAASLSTIACAAPYMLAVGALTKKKRIGEIASFSLPGIPLAQAGYPDLYPPQALLGQLAEAMQPVLFFVALIWLAAWIVHRLTRRPKLTGMLPRPNIPGAFLVISATFSLSLILMGLYSHVRYLDYRHAMFLGIILFPLVGAGTVFLEGLVSLLPRPRIARGLLLAGLSLALLLTLQPPHQGKGYYRDAGRYLAQIAQPGDYILAQNSLILYYAQVPGTLICPDRDSSDSIVNLAISGAPRATYLAISDKEIASANPALASRLLLPPFSVANSFTQKQEKSPDVIRIYRVAAPGNCR